MSSLKSLQRQFQAYLLHNEQEVVDQLLVPANLKEIDRLAVYRHAYFLRLHNRLAADFPHCRKYLGDSAFKNVVFEYLTTMPPSSYSICAVPMHFPVFLQNHDAFLAELAQFELELNQAAEFGSDSVATISDLELLLPEAWAQMVITLQPSVKLTTFTHDIMAAWQALNEDSEINEIQTTQQFILTWGHDFTSYYCEVDGLECVLVKALFARLPFSQLCQNMSKEMGETTLLPWISERIQAWLSQRMLQVLT